MKLSTFLIISLVAVVAVIIVVSLNQVEKDSEMYKNPFDDVKWVKTRGGASMEYVSYWPVSLKDSTELGGYVGSRGDTELLFVDVVGDSTKEVIGVQLSIFGEGWEKHILKAYKDSTGQTRFEKIYFETRWTGEYEYLNENENEN